MKALPGALMAIIGLGFSHAGEVLFHSGPVVKTPDAILLDPLNPEQKGKDLEFIHEFFAEADLLKRLCTKVPDPRVIPAAKAIHLATGSVEPRKGDDDLPANLLELMEYKQGDTSMRYYLICLQVDGSAETFRIVLMDGTVLKPRLRRITDEK